MPEEAETPAAEWRGLAVTYPGAASPAAGPLTLRLAPGERLLLLGPSGSGKSSLLLALTGLVPEAVPGRVAGEALIFGSPSTTRRPPDWADIVAHGFQDAGGVLCGMRVADEIGFAAENRALPPAEIERRVTQAMAAVGLPEPWAERRSLALSGGERQLVALAAILAQGAPVLLLDEPSAHLSPEAAGRLARILATRDGPARSVLVVDHRLDELIGTIDRVAVIGRSGALLCEGAPRALFRTHGARLAAEGVWRPAAAELDAALAEAGLRLEPPPLSIAEAMDALAGKSADVRVEPVLRRFAAARRAPPAAPGAVAAELRAAVLAPFGGPVVLSGIDLTVRAGETVALLGPNGAGKSTLGAALAGLLRLKGGTWTGPPGALLLQRPEDQFCAGSVEGEVRALLPKSLAEDEARRRVARALEAAGLAGLGARHPLALSEGQKRRLVLAAVDAADRWPLLVLDEPTAGLDAAGAAWLTARMRDWTARGRALVLVTHDMDFALALAPRAVVLAEGRIAADGPAAEVLADRALLTRAGLREPAALEVLRRLGEREGARCTA